MTVLDWLKRALALNHKAIVIGGLMFVIFKSLFRDSIQSNKHISITAFPEHLVYSLFTQL
jgi:hypothetical protein